MVVRIEIKKNMKKVLFVLVFLFFNHLYSQKICVQTLYKSIPPQEFSLETNDFTFDAKEGILHKKTTEDKLENTYFIKLEREFYDENKDFYFVEYKTDFKKRAEKSDKSEIGIYTIMYDKKDGDVMAVILYLLELDNTLLYLTEKGEDAPMVKAIFNATN